MRLQTESLPNSTDRHAAESGGLGQTARAPVGRARWAGFQRLNDYLLDMGIAHLARCSGTGLVIKCLHAALQKAGTPLDYHPWRDPQFACYELIAETLGGGEDHTCASRPHWLTTGAMGQRLQSLMFFCAQEQWLFGSSGTHLQPPQFRRVPRRLSSLISGTGH